MYDTHRHQSRRQQTIGTEAARKKAGHTNGGHGAGYAEGTSNGQRLLRVPEVAQQRARREAVSHSGKPQVYGVDGGQHVVGQVRVVEDGRRLFAEKNQQRPEDEVVLIRVPGSDVRADARNAQGRRQQQNRHAPGVLVPADLPAVAACLHAPSLVCRVDAVCRQYEGVS